MEMNKLPTSTLIDLLKELESQHDFNFNSVTGFLRLDDVASPIVLQQLHEAIDELDGIIPVFRKHDQMYLGFSKYEVKHTYLNNGIGIHYIQTTKGRVPFPETYHPAAFKEVKLTDPLAMGSTMRYKGPKQEWEQSSILNDI